MQYGPGYTYFQGYETVGWKLGSIEDEIEIIRLYGSKVMAIMLNMIGIDPDQEAHVEQQLRADLNMPVINVMKDGVDELIPVIENFIKEFKKL